MKLTVLLIIALILSSCGLPEYAYISVPVIKEKTESLLSVELPTEEYVNGYTLYARYYYSDSKEFQADDFESSNQRGSSFLQSKGFKEVSVLNESFNPLNLEIPSNRIISIEKITQTTQTEQSVNLNSNSSRFHLGLENSGSIYNNYHLLGVFTDIVNKEFVKRLITETQPEGSYVKIEFAIIVKGVKIEPVPEPIYSDPLYIGSFLLPI